MTADANITQIVREEQAKLRTERARKSGHGAVTAGSGFETVEESHYRLSFPAIGVTFDIDRLRRERSELIGELSVSCTLPGAQTIDGSLSVGDFNLSSVRAGGERAKLLATRARASEIDWIGLIEELRQRVLQAERTGQPAIDLRTVAPPETDDTIQVHGMDLYRRHPAILFGDGGTLKSYFALNVLGQMAERGFRVGYFDWELSPEEHRERLGAIFPDGMPRILYARCERPLVYEADRLRRIVRDNDLDFAVYDSIVFACDGPPEAAEIAGRYLRACRQIGCGSLHIAHITKGENGDQKPFGSVFWHNGARATWFVKLADGSQDSDVLRLGFYNQKSNLGRRRSPFGLTVTFSNDGTTFRRMDVADTPDLADRLSVRERMTHLLRKGALDPQKIADEIEAKADTVERTARRYKDQFIVLQGGRIGLAERPKL